LKWKSWRALVDSQARRHAFVVLAQWGFSVVRVAEVFSQSRDRVPLFFMLSGYLLLPKEDTDLFLEASNISSHSFSVRFATLFQSSARRNRSDARIVSDARSHPAGPRAPHLWYLYALDRLYLFTPICVFFIAARKLDIWYYILLWLLWYGGF
jgi:surface polysaccharide O-acyltransferase-like enzyme